MTGSKVNELSYLNFLRFCTSKVEETIGEAKTGLPSGELIEKQQRELDELTEKLENAERAQKQLFLIVFQVRLKTLTGFRAHYYYYYHCCCYDYYVQRC